VPPAPWRVELATGWTTAAIGSAIGAWFTTRLGASRDVVTTTDALGAGGDHDADNRFLVGEGLFAAGASMDVLLRLSPCDAARVTTLFSAVVDALSPWR
jgi:hypothetical protein